MTAKRKQLTHLTYPKLALPGSRTVLKLALLVGVVGLSWEFLGEVEIHVWGSVLQAPTSTSAG